MKCLSKQVTQGAGYKAIKLKIYHQINTQTFSGLFFYTPKSSKGSTGTHQQIILFTWTKLNEASMRPCLKYANVI